jgi:hypothetical protein
VSVFVVSKLLLLLSNINSDLDSLLNITDSTVQFECPLRFLRLIVNLPKEIVNEFMSECLNLDLGDHFNHIRDHLLAFSDVQLERLIVLLTLIVVLGCAAPLRFTLIVLGDSKMLINILFISLKNNFSILIHHLVRLGNNECLLSFSTKNQKFNCLLLESSCLAILCYHQGTLWQLRLCAEDMLSLFGIIEELQIKSNDVLIVIGSLIGFLGFSIILLSFFCFSHKN